MPDTTPKDIADVERSGKWTYGPTNRWKLPSHILYYWRHHGCPYIRGRTVKYKEEMVQVPDFMSPRRVYFYLTSQLESVAPKFHARKKQVAPFHGSRSCLRKDQVRQQMNALWAGSEEITHPKLGRCLRASRAWELLGVSQVLLSIWTTESCPYTEDNTPLTYVPRKVGGIPCRYYPLEELDDVVDRMSRPNVVLADDEIDLNGAARRTKLHPFWFQSDKRCQTLGLTKLHRPGQSNDGRASRPRPVFLKKEIEALRQIVATRGKRITAERAAMIRDRLAEVRTDVGASANAPAVGQPANVPTPPASSPTNGQPPAAERPRRRGPRRSTITQAVYDACYNLLAEGKSRREAMKELATRFPDPKYKSSIPKAERHVSEYARRRASDPDDPKPWPIPGKRK